MEQCGLIVKEKAAEGGDSKTKTGLIKTQEDDTSFIQHDAIDAIIRWYCREAGVRNLQKQIEKLCRKRAFQRAEIREKKENEKRKEEEAKKQAEEEKLRLEKEKER